MAEGNLARTEVDGIPTYWVRGSGTLRASLVFRIGMVDETLPTRGWLHLLEHLALHGRESIRTPVNGRVSLLSTSFDVEGGPDEVSAFLRDLCRWFTDPDLTPLDHELRVLRAEDANRPASSLGSHLMWRYGATGPGLAAYDELGLYRAGPDELRELVRRAFTAGNAALALSGEPPAGLELPLPAGPRLHAPRAIACEQPMPASFAGDPGLVGLSGALPRSAAATAMMRALRRALHADLRAAATGYSAIGGYDLVDAEQAVVYVAMDVLPEGSPGLVAKAADLVRRLRDDGISEQDLRDDVQRELAALDEDPSGRWQPFVAAGDALLGGPGTDRIRLAAELRELRVIDVRSAAAEFWHRLLVSAGPDASHGVLPYLDSIPNRQTFAVTDGWHFLAAGHPADRSRLVIGRHAAAVSGSAVEVTARYDETAALLAFADGGRRLIRRDGYQLSIEPAAWQRGTTATELVDAAVPAELTVRLPARPPELLPSPPPRRLRVALVALHPVVIVPLVLALGLVGAVLLYQASGRLIVVWLAGFSVMIAVGYTRAWRGDEEVSRR